MIENFWQGMYNNLPEARNCPDIIREIDHLDIQIRSREFEIESMRTQQQMRIAEMICFLSTNWTSAEISKALVDCTTDFDEQR